MMKMRQMAGYGLIGVSTGVAVLAFVVAIFGGIAMFIWP
jgi:hypothetical protein